MPQTLKPTERVTHVFMLTAPAAAAGQAAAQAAATPEPSVSDEVVTVTARKREKKREETTQSIPLSVTAFSALAIEAPGLNSIADVATQTPGFSFRSGFGQTFDRPVIRGMATIQAGANAAFFTDATRYKSFPLSPLSTFTRQ